MPSVEPPQPDENEVPSPAPLRVLVIEDNKTDRWFFAEILRSRGYLVVACDSGEAGLDSLGDGSPDIVLLDLVLPGISGIETCRRLKSDPRGADSFVIVVTGNSDPGALDEVLSAGADDFIKKPLDAQSFFVRVDIAQRRIRAQRELRRTEHELAGRTRELETLFSNVRDVFFSVDLTNDRLIQISPASEGMFGYPLEQLSGPDGVWRRMVVPDEVSDGSPTPEPSEEPRVCEYEIERLDGVRRWVRASIQVHRDVSTGAIRADGVVVDVTAERQARTELARRNDELAALYRLAELTLAVHGLDEGYAKILDLVSEVMGCEIVAIEHLDHDRDRLVMTAARGIPFAGPGTLAIPLHQTLSGKAVSTGKPLLVHAPGALREHANSTLRQLELGSYAAFPLLAAGKAFGTLLIADRREVPLNDAFERLGTNLATTVATYVENIEAEESIRRSEQRHRALAEQLQQANQELESFAYSVSHDLRAPLRTMQGFSHALLQNYGDQLPEEARDYANRIIASGRQSEQLISDLLAYSRLSFEKVKLEPVALEAVVQGALEQIEGDITESGATVTVETPLHVVSGNVRTLVQVIANLVSNAIKFVPDGRNPEVGIRAEENGNLIRLWVEDNGIGVPEGQEERIFRVFERLSHGDFRPGTGIGLAVVRRGMQRIDGRCGVRRLPGGGSAFWIEAPRAKERSWRPRRRGRTPSTR